MKNVNYVKAGRVVLSVFIAVILIGVGFWVYNMVAGGSFADGFNLDVDFSGGTAVTIDMEGVEYNTDEVRSLLIEKTGIEGLSVQSSGDNGENIVVKAKVEDIDMFVGEAEKANQATEEENTEATAEDAVEASAEEAAEEATEEAVEETAEEATEETEDKKASDSEIFAIVKEAYGLEASEAISVDTIGKAMSTQILTNSLLAVLIAMILMLLYITFRFEFSSAVAAIAGLFINIFIMLAFYIIFRRPVNNSFIAALLTIIGYSINNTIIIFDRIRENNRKLRSASYEEIANTSIGQTMARTINSTITTLFTIGMVYILGVSSIREFALPIIVGLVSGVISSIFICAPIWVWWKNAQKAKGRAARKAFKA